MRALPSPSVQLVTGAWKDPSDLEARISAALRGGIRWVQLRARERTARELYEATLLIAPIAADAGAMLVVNDRVDVALAAGAGGIHLPEAGMRPGDARRLLGPSAWIAQSLHSVDAIAAAPAGVLDAIQFGPVFETPSKRAFGPPQGLAELTRAANAAARSRADVAAGIPEHRVADIPAIIAVGGITPRRAELCRSAGAAAVAVIGAIWDADDVEGAARTFVQAQIASARVLV